MVPGFCGECGANIDATAQFCRQCGRPLTNRAPSINPAEATTRTLEEQQPPAGPPAQFMNSGNTGPGYLPPGQYAPVPQAPYPFVHPKKNYTPLFIIGGVLFLLLITLVIAGGIVSQRFSSGNETAPPLPQQPQVPTLPQQPRVPAPPRQPQVPGSSGTGKPASGAVTPDMAALVYPGSQVTREVNEEDKEVFLMTSSDPIDKVVDWYTNKLHPTKKVSIPFAGGAVLKNGDMGVVITGAPPNVQIILTRSE
jgi:hypothetical protein